MKKIVRSLFSMKVIMMIIIIIIILLLVLPSSVYYITIDDGTYTEDDWASTPYVASNHIVNLNIGDDGITSDQNVQELWDKMIQEGSNVDKYLDTPEELEKLMNAEVITQFPKIGKGDLDGIIQFERHKTDGTSNMLTYIDNETFNSYVNSGDKDVFDYFTLDDQNNVLVAVENTTTDIITSNDEEMDISEYTQNLNESNKKSDGNYEKIDSIITTVPIYYKNVVQKYTMPFQYLWALLVIGEDKDFVLELADLVENSEITISIYDNITTTVNKDEYIYYKETRTDTCVRLFIPKTFGVTKIPSERYWVSEDNEHYNSKYPADYSKDEETEYKITHTTTYENNRPIIDLTKANVWIVDYSKEYTYQSSESVSEESNEKSLDDTEWKLKDERTTPEDSSLYENAHAKDLKAEAKKYIENHRSSSSSVTAGVAGEFANALNGGNTEAKEEQEEVVVNIAHVDTKTYKHETNRKQTTSYSQSKQKYIAQTPINNPKVEKDAEEDNFVTILCKKSHKGAKKFITSEETSWLFEILEINPDTVNMVDLTKYLLYKVTGRNFGVTEYDFSEYEPGSFNSAGSAGGSLSLTTSTLDKDLFVAAMNAYAGKNSNFDSNFLPYAADIYDWSVASGVNPELVVITAKSEGGFKEAGGKYNYWGIGVPNGSKSGNSYSSLKAGIEGYAETILSFQTGWKAERINQLAIVRQSVGVDPLGYGAPDTLSGMQSLYSDLGNHVEGSSGRGGFYYMDPAIAGVTKIYTTHAEFLSKCRNSGLSEHAYGTVVTEWENGQYTAWQVEQKLKGWYEIFGAYGSLSAGNEEIIETAKSKLGCPYKWRS